MITEPDGTEAMAQLPRYQCHKRVWALKIQRIEQRFDEATGEGTGALLHALPPWKPIAVDDEWFKRHNPHPGGYWVQYDDGYQSFSPAKAFEEGYTLVSQGGG